MMILLLPCTSIYPLSGLTSSKANSSTEILVQLLLALLQLIRLYELYSDFSGTQSNKAEEKAHSVACLLCKHEDLSLIMAPMYKAGHSV